MSTTGLPPPDVETPRALDGEHEALGKAPPDTANHTTMGACEIAEHGRWPLLNSHALAAIEKARARDAEAAAEAAVAALPVAQSTIPHLPPAEGSADDLILNISTVRDVNAKSPITTTSRTWGEIAALLTSPKKHQRKKACPLFKLVTFGTKRTAEGAVRHNANALDVHGLVGDYDGESVTVEEAAKQLEAAGVEALIYTTPSHTAAKPRWRVVVPLSKPHSPADYDRLMDKLNGALGGVLAGESWTLSQVFYYGEVEGVLYETARARGRCIDVADVEPIGKSRAAVAAKGTPTSNKPTAAAASAPSAREDDSEIVRQIITTENYHGAVLTLTARYAARGMDEAAIVEIVRGLMRACDDSSDRWKARFSEIPRMVAGALRKFHTSTFDEIKARIAVSDLADTSERDTIADVLPMIAGASLSQTECEQLLKELKDKTGVALKALRYDLAALRRQSAADAGAVCASDPVATAKVLIVEQFTEEGERTLLRHQGAYYHWDGQKYARMSDEDVRSEIYTLFQRHEVPIETKGPIDNTLDALRAEANVPSALVLPAWTRGEPPAPVHELIACVNGLLHPAARALFPHTPRFFNVNAVAVTYAASADAPVMWFKFLSQAFPGDQATIDTLGEWFGYCLTHDTSLQKALICVGPKRSGKGTIARVLQRLLGEFNVCGPTLAALARQFGLEGMLGKLLAIISDARVSGSADVQSISESILRITGEDTVSVPRKHIGDWVGKLHVRFMLLTNILPGIIDAGGAIASRFILLNFTQSFYGREDAELTPKLLAELPGILSWALDGLDRLRGRGCFVQPPSGEEAMQQLVRKTVPVSAFIEDVLDFDSDAWVSKDEMYGAYGRWCDQQGHKFVLHKDRFLEELYRNAEGRFTDCRPRNDNGERVRAVLGVTLRAEWAASDFDADTAGLV